MLIAMFQALLSGVRRSRRARCVAAKPVHTARFAPSLQTLEGREMPAVSALFNPAHGGHLAVFGDAQDNAIAISRDAAGNLLVNGGAVTIKGGNPTVANTTSIKVFGLAGNDTITLNEANGALPRANLFGGAGSDVLTGGAGADHLFGQAGNDTLLGKDGNDTLFGGAGNDALTAGKGDDRVFGQAGNDRMIWNPGDGSALNEGGAGNDTVEVIGGNVSEAFLATVVDDIILFERIDPAPFSLVIGTSENLVVQMSGGDDTFAANGNIAGLVVDGGAGDDTILGGSGNDMLIGGDGKDFIDGNQGSDVAKLGAGDDVFSWDAGDGSDTVEGEDGVDAMLFNGANINEKIDISANGHRVRFSRDIGNIVMDLNGVEGIDFNANGGTDTVTVNDLSGTNLTEINLRLASNAGVSQPATIVVNGTIGDDAILVAGDATGVSVVGLAAQVNIIGTSAANDRLTINALAGDDVADASGLADGAIQFTANGGDGEDVLTGSDGSDLLNGGNGDDVLTGGPGQDVLDGGPGGNVVIQ